MPWTESKRDSTGRKRYRGVYRDATGRQRSRTFNTQSAAKRWAGEEEAKVHRGQRSDPASARMLWEQWAEQWWPSKRIEPGTRKRDESRLNAHVRPRWGKTPLIGIRRIDVQAWVNELDRIRSASTVRACYYLLSNSMRAAVEEGILTASPCVGVHLPTLPSGQERYLTDVESGQLLYHLDGRYRVFAELVLGTGLRVSEAAGLHVARVDIQAQRLEVIEVYDAITGQMRGYPKSKRRRSVPLSPELAALLQDWLDRHPPKATCGKPHRGGRCHSGLLITGPQGAPLDPHNFEERQWREAAMQAGFFVDEGENTKGRRKRRITVHPHDLRHTYASRLVQQGVPMDTVQRLLGHEDPQTTQRYARFRDGDGWDEVRGALSTSVTAARAAMADGATDGAESGDKVIQQAARQRRLRAL